MVSDKVIAGATFQIDPTKKPNSTNATYTEGSDMRKAFKGIYQLDGNMLKVCRAGSPNEERPTEFTTKAGTGQLASAYMRAKQ
jgi:uncharacterized protein (TIGR03067 family)